MGIGTCLLENHFHLAFSFIFLFSSLFFISPLFFPIKLKIVNVLHLTRVDRLMDFSFSQSFLIKHLNMPDYARLVERRDLIYHFCFLPITLLLYQELGIAQRLYLIFS